MLRACFFAFLFLAATSQAQSQGLVDLLKLQLCRGLKDDALRLKCFDEVTSQLNPKTRAEKNEDPLSDAVPTWTVKEDRSPIDDSVQVMGILSATDQGNGGSLMIRCKENKTEAAFLPSGAFIGTSQDRVRVLYRIDQNKPIEASWSPSQNGQATFATGAVAFVKSLTENGTLFIRAHGYGGRTYDATFKLGNVSKVQMRIAEACKWPKR